MEENKNQPAFPVPAHPYLGLTKREWFSGMILQGICANSATELSFKEEVSIAIKEADELLKQLAGG